MAASHFRVHGLTVVLDANGLTQHGPVDTVMTVEPVAERFRAFGWNVVDIDGHDPHAVAEGLSSARALDGPSLVIARTIKGHHVSFMENDPLWHSRAMNDQEYAAALAEIENRGGHRAD